MGLKELISPPLEAGPSVLDGHHLPAHLTPALEYASSRLARKSIHLTLVVVRRDYHVPTTPMSSPLSSTSCSFHSASSASSSSSLSPSSLSKFSFAAGSVAALKQLVRSGSCRQGAVDPWARSTVPHDRWPATTATATLGIDAPPGLELRWPLSPTMTTPLSSPPPMTPCTPSSMATTTTTTDHAGPPTPGAATGLLLLHAPDLSPRNQRMQRAVLAKTALKYNESLLGPAVSPAAYGLGGQLFTNSVIQHDVLFSSDGLTILSLDRLYSLKAALASYSRTKAPPRLEDAVDELRRYVLATHGAKVTRSDLCRAYDWLNVGPGAIADLDAMYRRAYGGPDQVGAIAGLDHDHPGAHASPALPSHRDQPPELAPEQIGLAVTTLPEPSSRPASPSRASSLASRTGSSSSARPLVLRSKWGYEEDEEDDDQGDRAHPTPTPPAQDLDEDPKPQRKDSSPPAPVTSFVPCQSTSIDGRLLGAGPDPDATAMQDHGPLTPNGYEDISPITRGEWGFLMVDESFRSGRTVNVETC
ncbi:hypothetical protein E4U42_000477 [Claviceps africana]|uniref:DUF7582 domain-containing protein n=1 Tax=Claviceps africana TaxID=83212 RepID=A0A8K0NFK6_9HYPO|nr:hypothetical protein E4U42_000477 [Claviceps africana]